MDSFIKQSARDDPKHIFKSEHALMLKAREDELITDMRSQLVKGHADMRKQTAEVVEAVVSDKGGNHASRELSSTLC